MVLAEEQHILDTAKMFPPLEQHTNPEYAKDWLTNRLYDYNLIDYCDKYDSMDKFRVWIKEQVELYFQSLGLPKDKLYIQCWANVIRNDGRRIIKHHHADDTQRGPQEYSYLSGNICIQADNTNTYYQHPFLDKRAMPIKNIPSELILFPSYMVHWTDTNQAETPRISIAFDLITQEVYDMISDNSNYRPL